MIADIQYSDLIDITKYDDLIYITKCIQNLNNRYLHDVEKEFILARSRIEYNDFYIIESIIEKSGALFLKKIPFNVANAIFSLRQEIQYQVAEIMPYASPAEDNVKDAFKKIILIQNDGFEKVMLQPEIEKFITFSVNKSLEGSEFSELDKNNLIKTLTEQIHIKAKATLDQKGIKNLIEQLTNQEIKEECIKALTTQKEGFSALIKDKTGLRKIVAIIWDVITFNIKAIFKPHKAIENPINNSENAVVKSVIKPPQIREM